MKFGDEHCYNITDGIIKMIDMVLVQQDGLLLFKDLMKLLFCNFISINHFALKADCQGGPSWLCPGSCNIAEFQVNMFYSLIFFIFP